MRHLTNRRIGVVLAAAALMFSMSISYGTARAGDLLYSDKPLSIKVRDVDIRDVLRIIAEEYDLNIVIGKGVGGRISYEIENTTLQAGFGAILRSNGLGYIIEDNIIRVDDLKTLRTSLQDELEIHRTQQQLRQAQKLKQPLITEEIKLEYIGDTLSTKRDRVKNLKEILEPLLSHKKEKGIDRGANIQLLEDTNTLVVTDVEENVREIVALAKNLDKPPAQVRIEARVIERSSGDLLGLGIQWGVLYESSKDTDGLPKQSIGGRRGSDTGSIQGTSQNLGVDLPITGIFAPIGTIGYTLLDNLSLDIELQAMEEKGKISIVSRPSIQVLENENAEILVGQQVPVAVGLDPETGQTEVDQQDIGTKLNITPQITRDGNVVLNVEIERSALGDTTTIANEEYTTINKRNANSQVRVRNGETVVIGGLMLTEEQKRQRGVPFFSKIHKSCCLYGSDAKK